MSLFSQNLRFLRKKGNHNQEEIARIFNKQANTVGNWENQKSEPSFTELMRLGEFFQVSVENLLLTDLELQTRQTAGISPSTGSSQTLISGSLTEYGGNKFEEAGPDAFWLILRELRAVHEKVDLLIADRESAADKRNADKSYH
jgi:transcriptional regulator with XRE-family HTH domain